MDSIERTYNQKGGALTFYLIFRMETDGKIEVLIMENDRLIQETLRQSAEIEALTSKLSQASRKGICFHCNLAQDLSYLNYLAAQATADLDNQNEELASIREHLDETIEGKKLIERQLKFGNQEIASRDAEIDKLNENFQKKEREIENLTRKNEEHKKYAIG